MRVARVVHPGVRPDFLDTRPLVPVVGEEAQDEVFEWLAEVITVNFREVGVKTAIEDETVEVLLLARLLEGEDTLDDDKEDDSEGEQVNLSALVALAFLYLGRHVSHRAAVRFQRIDRLVTSETEVRYLQIELVVDEDVLELEVSVHDALLMHVVDGVEELGDEEATSVLPHRAHRLAKVKKQSAGHVLHHNVNEVADVAAAWLDHLARVAVAEHADDVRMVHVLQNRDLVVHRQDGVGVAAEELLFENLDGGKGAVLSVASEVHLGSVPFAETLDDLVLSVKNRVSLSSLHFGAVLLLFC